MSAKCKRRIGDYNRPSPLIAIACSFCPTLLTFSATIHRCDLRLLTYYQTHTQYARFHHFTNLANYSTPGRGLSTVMMSVCPLAYLRNRTRQLRQIFCACFPCPSHDSVLHWWHCDMLCTSGLVDGGTFVHLSSTNSSR